jgi:hypothetical protein
MTGIQEPHLVAEDDVNVACTSLVVVPPAEQIERSSKPVRVARPDPSFLTHLLATAAQVPQTRNHRRAAQADALSAYSAYQGADQIGFRTRQVI